AACSRRSRRACVTPAVRDHSSRSIRALAAPTAGPTQTARARTAQLETRPATSIPSCRGSKALLDGALPPATDPETSRARAGEWDRAHNFREGADPAGPWLHTR